MPAPKNPNTRAATAKRVRAGQETAAAKLRAAGWATLPPETDPIPDAPGVYLSDTIYSDPAFSGLTDAAAGLWTRCLVSPLRVTIDGKAAIPAEVAHALTLNPANVTALVDARLWTYLARTDTYLFERPGQVYAIVGPGATADSRTGA